jgi:hypothetical protein
MRAKVVLLEPWAEWHQETSSLPKMKEAMETWDRPYRVVPDSSNSVHCFSSTQGMIEKGVMARTVKGA